MARNLSLAMGRGVPSFSLPKVLGAGRATNLSIHRSSQTVRDAVAGTVNLLKLIVAAGRIGAAVDARQVPSASDLKTVGLEDAEILRRTTRI